ncbi:MAG: right-handed parallel beta-helix repeat-containing protein [Chitinophagales bacterium]|nr:right-handed parallel beta-helix repeat-containing protein [Chitinophagales bacterium]
MDKNHPSASDSNPGTEGLPWASIQHAANSATAGSTVYIKAGTYYETIWLNVSGSAGNYITFTNHATDVVTIDGGSTGAQTLLFAIFDKDYIKIDGLNFQNATGNFSSGIYIAQGADYVEITNNTISNIHFSNNPADPVTSSTNVNPFVVYNEYGNDACSNILVDGNEIYNCRTGFSEALTLSGNVESFVVSNNTVHDITNIGIDIAGGYGVSSNAATDMARNGTVTENTTYNCVSNYAVSAGIYVDGGHNILIENNVSYANGRGFEVGCEPLGHTTSGITVRNNLAYNNLEAGIGIGGYDFTGGNTGKVTDSQIFNNTFYNNNTTNIWNGELLVEYTENCTIKNNIFSAQNTQNMLVVTRENSIGLTIDYNLYSHPSGTASVKIDYEGAVYTGFSTYQSGSGLDANSIFGTPGFIAPGSQNFDISSSSSAIDAGDPAFSVGPSDTDYAGNPRLVGTIIDIGAYEYQSILPVEFVDFYARQEGSGTILKWITTIEENSNLFEVERRGAEHNFQKIGEAPAQNKGATYYFFDDQPLNGINYYRLRQLDFDGTTSYSPTLAVTFKGNNFSVYPNPFSSELIIDQLTYPTSMAIISSDGKIVYEAVAENARPINLSFLEKGSYILLLYKEELVEAKRIFKH